MNLLTTPEMEAVNVFDPRLSLFIHILQESSLEKYETTFPAISSVIFIYKAYG